MKRIIGFSVNGESVECTVEPQETLVEVLRNHLGLTGTKEGCGTGECGSCTVLMEGKPVLSCLTLAVDCCDKDIVTIEGIAIGDQLSPVQQAFLDCGAIQCGFCTPGMVLSTEFLLKENPNPREKDIYKALEGNLCRCTGYNKIIEAVHKASKQMLAEQE